MSASLNTSLNNLSQKISQIDQHVARSQSSLEKARKGFLTLELLKTPQSARIIDTFSTFSADMINAINAVLLAPITSTASQAPAKPDWSHEIFRIAQIAAEILSYFPTNERPPIVLQIPDLDIGLALAGKKSRQVITLKELVSFPEKTKIPFDDDGRSALITTHILPRIQTFLQHHHNLTTLDLSNADDIPLLTQTMCMELPESISTVFTRTPNFRSLRFVLSEDQADCAVFGCLSLLTRNIVDFSPYITKLTLEGATLSNYLDPNFYGYNKLSFQRITHLQVEGQTPVSLRTLEGIKVHFPLLETLSIERCAQDVTEFGTSIPYGFPNLKHLSIQLEDGGSLIDGLLQTAKTVNFDQMRPVTENYARLQLLLADPRAKSASSMPHLIFRIAPIACEILSFISLQPEDLACFRFLKETRVEFITRYFKGHPFSLSLNYATREIKTLLALFNWNHRKAKYARSTDQARDFLRPIGCYPQDWENTLTDLTNHFKKKPPITIEGAITTLREITGSTYIPEEVEAFLQEIGITGIPHAASTNAATLK